MAKLELHAGVNMRGLIVVDLVSVGEGTGRRDVFRVRCERCGHEYTTFRNSLEQRMKRECYGCKCCRSSLVNNGHKTAGFKNCRTCDDCPALRPIGGCPACGEPSSKRRAA